MPPRASVAAIPGPIVPRPITAAFVMSSPRTLKSTRINSRGGWSADGLLECRSCRHLAAPCLQPIERRQRDREIETAMNDRAEADVGQGDGAAGEPGAGLERTVQDLQLLAEFLGVLGPARA